MTPEGTGLAGSDPENDARESGRILSRVGQEADGSAMAGPGRGGSSEDDWIERTGTRIGRVLGPVLLFCCAVWLLFHLMAGR